LFVCYQVRERETCTIAWCLQSLCLCAYSLCV
jgi:hypothetical protein